MEFEWDDAKRMATIAERKLDFADAFLGFDGRPVIHQTSPRGAEERCKTTTMIEGKFFTLVWA